MIENLFILIEEPSAEPVVRRVAQLILPNIQPTIYTFQGKQNLLRKLPNRLKGLRNYLPGNSLILILVDRDAEDCVRLKQRLEAIANEAGFNTKTSVGKQSRYQVTNRIAIEELEAWFFGDWNAMRLAYPALSANVPNKSIYRNPDAISGTWEALEKVLQSAGYFRGGLRKIELAQEVSQHLTVGNNRSHSFNFFCEALQAAAG